MQFRVATSHALFESEKVGFYAFAVVRLVAHTAIEGRRGAEPSDGNGCECLAQRRRLNDTRKKRLMGIVTRNRVVAVHVSSCWVDIGLQPLTYPRTGRKGRCSAREGTGRALWSKTTNAHAPPSLVRLGGLSRNSAVTNTLEKIREWDHQGCTTNVPQNRGGATRPEQGRSILQKGLGLVGSE
jgi:hypothetical protein